MSSEESTRDSELLVFIPTYNDYEVVGEIIAEIRSTLPESQILVLDDGSQVQDNANVFDDLRSDPNILFYRLPTNFGLGVCTNIAFDFALSADYPNIVRIDADGQHLVSDIPQLLGPLREGNADLIVGTRINRNSRRGVRGSIAIVARQYMSLMARILTDRRAPLDVNSGFFAANKRAMATLNQFQYERYPEPQMYILGCRRGLRVQEVSISQREREHGSSTLTLGHALRLFYRFNIFILAEVLQRSRVE